MNQWGGGPGRHIILRLQCAQERHQRRIIPPAPFRFVCVGNLAFGQSPGFHLEIDFCIDVGRVERNMAEPSANGVDVHAGTEQVRGRGMACGG